MHSATKYLGGHSDVIAGALVIEDKALGDELHFKQFATGGTLGPMDSFLSIKRNQNPSFTRATSL